ncbi:type II toxin-antitoxin system HicB family antitoxin [Pediococcus stilesii]|uniref:HicB-like antitoxin of toxin-antitoxin system domain-containing protein n=1 Tax=Pediococcus stilesii TaxID=331679 RepID=A0A0R2L4M1_9LACO|nr:type II toxin-antitoxin system HicB family antitoxin [Pediococcus stilesii]KRN93853.1 hypothetical protein IV81_GL000259 [Pediococcus stilesii]
MRLVSYTAVFDDSLNNKGEYTVTFPDVAGVVTDGNSFTEAIQNAQEALGLMLYDREELPKVTDQKTIEKANPDKLVTTIATDLDVIKNDVKEVSVKKNTRIPADLAKAAEEKGINFSAVLTEALKKELAKS